MRFPLGRAAYPLVAEQTQPQGLTLRPLAAPSGGRSKFGVDLVPTCDVAGKGIDHPTAGRIKK